jgi:hypothetical protein
MINQKIKVSKETVELIESLLWVMGSLPVNVGMSVTKENMMIYNVDKQRELQLEIEKEQL